jgi:hypothetical protein
MLKPLPGAIKRPPCRKKRHALFLGYTLPRDGKSQQENA